MTNQAFTPPDDNQPPEPRPGTAIGTGSVSPSRAYGTPTTQANTTIPATGAREGAGEQIKDQASAVKDTAAAKAGDMKDVAAEGAGQVMAVGKDELARLTDEARGHVQSMWSQAGDQVREQTGTGIQQVSQLLHTLSAELGEMAAKSDQDGPLAALARQGAASGGRISHWLSQADPGDVLDEIRRFARRRPVVFLGGAALAGVVVGRLSRGLMAPDEAVGRANRAQLGPNDTSRLPDGADGSIP